MAELMRGRLAINYQTVDESLTILESDARLKRLLKGTRMAIAFSGSPYDGGIFEVGAATAFTIERATADWFTKAQAPEISYFTMAATLGALLKMNDVVATDSALGGNSDYVEVYEEAIKAIRGDAFLADIERTRFHLFPALDQTVFYLGAVDLSLILGFEKAKRLGKLKEQYNKVVNLPALNPYNR